MIQITSLSIDKNEFLTGFLDNKKIKVSYDHLEKFLQKYTYDLTKSNFIIYSHSEEGFCLGIKENNVYWNPNNGTFCVFARHCWKKDLRKLISDFQKHFDILLNSENTVFFGL